MQKEGDLPGLFHRALCQKSSAGVQTEHLPRREIEGALFCTPSVTRHIHTCELREMEGAILQVS